MEWDLQAHWGGSNPGAPVQNVLVVAVSSTETPSLGGSGSTTFLGLPAPLGELLLAMVVMLAVLVAALVLYRRTLGSRGGGHPR